MKNKSILIYHTSILIGLIFPTVCSAANYVTNSSPSLTINSVGDTIFNAKLRASNGNFDQSIATTSSTLIGNVVSRDLGNVNKITSRIYQFTLEHRVGQGFIFTTIDNQSAPFTSITAYGTGFSPALPPTVGNTAVTTVAILNTFGGSGVPIAATALGNYNSLLVETRTTAFAGNPDESITFNNLAFSSPTINFLSGSLITSSTVTPTTTGSTSGEIVGGVPATAANGTLFQRIISDGPLNNHNWTFSGNVQLIRSGAGDGEGLRFAIYGQNIDAIFAVPEPSHAILSIMGLCAVMLKRKR
jgi:hypothetical protein